MPHEPAAITLTRPMTAGAQKKHAAAAPTSRPLRILLVTPEICASELLDSNGGKPVCVKAGGLADMSALLLDSVTAGGMDVPVALPNYRSLIEVGANGHSSQLHLCEDRELCDHILATVTFS